MADKVLQEATQKVTTLQEHMWWMQKMLGRCIDDEHEINWWSEMRNMRDVLVLMEKETEQLSADLAVIEVYVAPVGHGDDDMEDAHIGKRACKGQSGEYKERKKEFFAKEWEGSMMLRTCIMLPSRFSYIWSLLRKLPPPPQEASCKTYPHHPFT